MKQNTKNFILGMLLGLMPVTLYGFIRLSPPKPQPQVLAAYTEYVPETDFLNIPIKTSSQSAQIVLTEFPILSPIPTPNSEPEPSPTPFIQKKQIVKPQAPENVQVLIQKYASRYGVNKDMMVGIAKCESGFRENAVNGPYAGIYQFVGTTWISNRRAMGEDPNPDLRFNAEEAIKTAAFKMGRDGYGAWPVCQVKARRSLGLSSSEI